MLEVENISAGYGKNNVINDISFTVKKGELYVLLGPNGSGKTTTFRAVSGVIPLSKGRVIIEGIDLNREPELAKRKLGYLPEGERVYPNISVYKNLLFFAKIYDVDRGKIDVVLKEFGLEKYKNSPAGYLSRGMRKKLALARALLHDPEVIIFDEPFSNLDMSTVLRLRDEIKKMIENDKIILFSTHILSELQYFEDVNCKVAFINEGRIILERELEELAGSVNNILVVFRVTDKTRAMEVLTNLGYDVSIEQSGVVVRVSNYHKEVPAILKILLTHDITVYEARPKESPVERFYRDFVDISPPNI
ncbi:ABC transporter ATP-binding protein [Pyrococcus furiosus DSM 3638]|uniref:ABC transporter ATP-binding protein n=2 Tax=Pyrococcus furiosus TaxID=2261 RepID=A0A5C0XN65_PYRFU|nr:MULTISPECIES: ABC transporter ATP-binding protein [Pyrococcus]AFN03714.1 ABC transporter [Pyrococcus furiosus COM1]MDK2869738.1 type transport system ATP-binding protein [Pyrococcus sp.]QEK78586.1 ABC transporter ATP-binding protein [Pyrococcus furiosus DSM 3638]